LFAKLPPKEKVAAAPVVVSFQTAPLLSVTSPVNVMTRAVVLVEPKFIVPEMVVAPLTVNDRHMVSEAPLLMVRDPHTNVLALLVTGEPAAIITGSVAVGVPFGLHVVVVDQSPPAPVLV